MRRKVKTIALLLAIVSGPILLSYFSPYILSRLIALGIAHDIQTPEYIRTVLLCVDLLLQILFFSFVAFAMKRFFPLVLQLLYCGTTAFMFLRYGSSTLYDSIVGSVIYFGML
jgi:hypothetical protein